MKKRFLLGSLVCVMALVLAGAAFAVGHENTGHVGHVADGAFDSMVTELSADVVAAVSNDSIIPAGASITSVVVCTSSDIWAEVSGDGFTGEVENGEDAISEAFTTGVPGSANGSVTAVHAFLVLSMNHPNGFGENPVVLNFTGCPDVEKANYVWIGQHEETEYNAESPEGNDYGSKAGDGNFHAFPIVNENNKYTVTIPAGEAGKYFSEAPVIATTVTPKAAPSDSDGGCNVGIFAPAAVLLLAPLALLLKR